jgi:hypothetical protein
MSLVAISKLDEKLTMIFETEKSKNQKSKNIPDENPLDAILKKFGIYKK